MYKANSVTENTSRTEGPFQILHHFRQNDVKANKPKRKCSMAVKTAEKKKENVGRRRKMTADLEVEEGVKSELNGEDLFADMDSKMEDQMLLEPLDDPLDRMIPMEPEQIAGLLHGQHCEKEEWPQSHLEKTLIGISCYDFNKDDDEQFGQKGLFGF